MEKEMVQSVEWLEAQKIEIGVDLFVAAKQHLRFLGVVDQNRWLYDGPMLERAVYRYNAFWLPLLAKYSESSPVSEGPLVPPLDCEWIWHCHRLNPARYKSDCEQFYGRVLDNYGTTSSTNGNCKLRTENLWKKLYAMEPYDLDLDNAITKPEDFSAIEKCTTYDLVSAVKRQSSFYGKIPRAQVDNDIFLQKAVGRYKAFLYLTKINREKSIDILSVPTIDIDLIWHTHQLNPSYYYKDMRKIFGNILQHDDTDTPGSKRLKTGFSGTTAQWEKIFGHVYSKKNASRCALTTVEEKNASICGAACVTCGPMEGEKKNASICGAACVTCGPMEGEKKNASICGAACVTCGPMEVEKKNASICGAACVTCGPVEVEKKNASICGAACVTCGPVEVDKNGGCGIIMKNNDNENVQNNPVAA